MAFKSALVDSFRGEMAKSKDPTMMNESQFDVGYPTGYLAFDFINGTKV